MKIQQQYEIKVRMEISNGMSKEKSYKEIEVELHAVLDRVEHESYDELDKLLEDYDTGMKLIAVLQDKLETAKNSIKKAPK